MPGPDTMSPLKSPSNFYPFEKYNTPLPCFMSSKNYPKYHIMYLHILTNIHLLHRNCDNQSSVVKVLEINCTALLCRQIDHFSIALSKRVCQTDSIVCQSPPFYFPSNSHHTCHHLDNRISHTHALNRSICIPHTYSLT